MSAVYLSSICYKYSTWISQKKHKTGKKNSQTFYKNYISSVNKPTRIIVQIHMCD